MTWLGVNAIGLLARRFARNGDLAFVSAGINGVRASAAPSGGVSPGVVVGAFGAPTPSGCAEIAAAGVRPMAKAITGTIARETRRGLVTRG